ATSGVEDALSVHRVRIVPLCGAVAARGCLPAGLRVPGVEARDRERFEVFNVARGNRHISRLCDGGDESVVKWRVLGNPVGGKDAGSRQVEGQYTVIECN